MKKIGDTEKEQTQETNDPVEWPCSKPGNEQFKNKEHAQLYLKLEYMFEHF